jgi:hypothetical protein
MVVMKSEKAGFGMQRIVFGFAREKIAEIWQPDINLEWQVDGDSADFGYDEFALGGVVLAAAGWAERGVSDLRGELLDQPGAGGDLYAPSGEAWLWLGLRGELVVRVGGEDGELGGEGAVVHFEDGLDGVGDIFAA